VAQDTWKRLTNSAAPHAPPAARTSNCPGAHKLLQGSAAGKRGMGLRADLTTEHRECLFRNELMAQMATQDAVLTRAASTAEPLPARNAL
jgi:hypothetical protein